MTKNNSKQNLLDYLIHYAHFHRSARNITTHYFGIPMIVWAIIALLSRPFYLLPLSVDNSSVSLSMQINPAFLIIVALYFVFYRRLDIKLANIITIFYLLCWGSTHWLSTFSTAWWLSISGGIFILGWVIQFIGHIAEGKKPAFFDDIRGLLIGLLFVAVEWGFHFGCRLDLKKSIKQAAGTIRYENGANRFTNFAEFYPYYLSEHSNPTCRTLHYFGSWLVIIVLIYTLFTQNWINLWLLPLIGYGFAWLGHFLFEKNRPATFTYPIYSLIGDWKMWWQIHQQISQRIFY